MRYERKYRIELASYEEVLHTVKMNQAAFRTAFPDRWVNSVYMDSVQWTALAENLAGISERIKFRVRWYGEDFMQADNPILEKKIKVNQLGDKEYFELADFNLGDNPNFSELITAATPEAKGLFPIVMIRYFRTYFISHNQKIRLTIDRSLSYFMYNNLHFFQSNPIQDDAIILEIKYDEKDISVVEDVLQNIPFRLTKNSKFVSGVIGNYF